MPHAKQNSRLLNLSTTLLVLTLACSVWELFVDVRSLQYIWLHMLAACLGIFLLLWYSRRPSFLAAMLFYLSLMLLLLGTVYGIWFWPWKAPGGVPLGRDSRELSAAGFTGVSLFFVWPMLFKVHHSLAVGSNHPFNPDAPVNFSS